MRSTPQSRVRGIILAGVHAWGESVLERICPRPLLPIAGRPLVWYGLDWLRRGGVGDIAVCANSDTHTLKSCLGNGSKLGVSLDYYEDVMPRGPAGCTRDAALCSDADTFVVVQGTVLPQINLESLLQAHQRSGATLTLVALEPSAKNGGSRAMEPAGIYVVSRPGLSLVSPKGYQDIKEAWIPDLYEDGHGCTHTPSRPRRRLESWTRGVTCVRPSRFSRASRPRTAGKMTIAGWARAWVHKSARVSPSAHLAGSTLIGPGAWINRNATIVGPTIVGANTQVGADAVLNNVVAWSGCEVGQGAILNQCILLAGSSIEPELVVRGTIYCGHLAQDSVAPGVAAEYWALHSCSEGSLPIRPVPPSGEPLAGLGARS